MNKFHVTILTIDGTETVIGQMDADTEQEIIDKIFNSSPYYDFRYFGIFYRISISHITKVSIQELV